MRSAIRLSASSEIVFGGVDESAWLWLNGEKLGSHSADRKEG